jgi:hypothetical protein
MCDAVSGADIRLQFVTTDLPLNLCSDRLHRGDYPDCRALIERPVRSDRYVQVSLPPVARELPVLDEQDEIIPVCVWAVAENRPLSSAIDPIERASCGRLGCDTTSQNGKDGDDDKGRMKHEIFSRGFNYRCLSTAVDPTDGGGHRAEDINRDATGNKGEVDEDRPEFPH